MSYCHVCKKKIGFFESLAFHGKCYACSSKAHTKFTERKKEKSQKEVIEKNSEERVDLTKLVFKIVVLFLLAFILSAISQTPCLFSLLINFIVLGLLYWAYIKFMKPRFEKPITSKHIKIIDPERLNSKKGNAHSKNYDRLKRKPTRHNDLYKEQRKLNKQGKKS